MKKSRKSIVFVLIAALMLLVIPPTFMNSVANAAASAVKLVIQPKQVYESVYYFYDGLSRVSMNKKYGFVDSTGKEVIPLKYESASSFSEGLAAVKLNGKTGFIDKKGKTVVPFKYDSACDFQQGLAAVELKKKWGLVNKAGKEIVKPQYDEPIFFRGFSDVATVYLNEKVGAVNKAGKEIVAPKHSYIYSLGEGLLCVQDKDKKSIFDNSGKQIAKDYNYVGSFYEGAAVVAKDDKYGMIDRTGKEIVPLEYSYLESMSEGLASASKAEKYGFIDKTGKTIIPFDYDQASSFEKGYAVGVKNDKSVLIDKTGKQADNNSYDRISLYTTFGLRTATLNGKLGIINGNKFVPMNYNRLRIISDSLVCVTDNNGKYGCVDVSGKVIVQPKYDDVFVINKYIIMVNGKNYSVADKTGKVLGSFNCDYIMNGSNDDTVFWVYNGDKASLVKLP